MFVFIDFGFGGFVVFVVWVAGFACLFLSGLGLGVLVVSGVLWWFWVFCWVCWCCVWWVWCCCVLVGCCDCLVGFVYFVVLWWLFKLLLDGLGLLCLFGLLILVVLVMCYCLILYINADWFLFMMFVLVFDIVLMGIMFACGFGVCDMVCVLVGSCSGYFFV